jgi:endonuclease VIII
VPEGDTIAQSAATLAGVLVGRAVTGFRSTVPDVAARAAALGIVGSQVTAVESRGKHLLVHVSAGVVLRTHMRMTGSWHLYRVGTRWWKPASFARVILEAGDVVAVCFSAPEVELLSASQLAGHAALQQLGPDLLAPDFDEAEALARLRAADREIADALLNQAIAADIGNVYKSEVLFLERVNPFARVAVLDDDTLCRLLRTARRQLQRNVGTSERRTTHGAQRSALWVYGRAGRAPAAAPRSAEHRKARTPAPPTGARPASRKTARRSPVRCDDDMVRRNRWLRRGRTGTCR